MYLELDATTGTCPPEDWSAIIESGSSGDQYEYEHGSFGSITDRTFDIAGHEYVIDHIKWDDGDDKLEIKFDDCIAHSEISSVALDSRVFGISTDHLRSVQGRGRSDT